MLEHVPFAQTSPFERDMLYATCRAAAARLSAPSVTRSLKAGVSVNRFSAAKRQSAMRSSSPPETAARAR